jgi:hypothetical protein
MPNDPHRRAWLHFDLLHSSAVVATPKQRLLTA